MAREPLEQFPGFQDFRANVTFVPLQFFTVILPHCSRGTVRIVGYALRKVLGWVDEHGNPTREQLRFTYRELIDNAGVSRDSIADAIKEAVEAHCLRCVQFPQPDRSGQSARSGIYELCWDRDGRYTDSPADFRGFYFPEAAMVEVQDEKRTVQRPKAARKNIPNAFFDYLLPRERLSVIRLVGAILFYSIQWGPGGERKAPVTRSITELSRLMKLSRHHVHNAVMEARRSGYIERTDVGCFDQAAGKQSRAATYAIRWTKSPYVAPNQQRQDGAGQSVGKGEREAVRSERVNGSPVENSERNLSEEVNGEQSKMVNGISIKRELKNLQSTTAAVAVRLAFDLLRSAGFDETTAKCLAGTQPWDVIQRQVEWLPRRNVSRNRLGLLRRAIEADWPKPDVSQTDDPRASLAREFASHYYAAYHGFEGKADTEPFPRDMEMAARFVSRLLDQEGDENLVPQWGKRFGRMILEKHQGDPKAKPNLSFSLVLFGDKFLRLLQQENAARQRQALGKARDAHHEAFTASYVAYLRLAELELRRAHGDVYEAFLKHRQRLRQLMTGGPFLATAERLARFESEEGRLLDFAAFFENHATNPVLSFWGWDARLNPQSFRSNAKVNTQDARS